MNNRARVLQYGLLIVAVLAAGAAAESMTFDQSQWATGDMNAQYPADSNGVIANSHVDYFYYYERLPMCQTVIDDSLSDGSSSRTYDSARLMLVVAADGLIGNDSMLVFGKRLTRPWSENGVSWNYHHASSDSAWAAAGGDFNNLPCLDSLIIDSTINVYDSVYFHLDTGFVRLMIESQNLGWLMMAENIIDRATLQFFTEDATNPSYRPVLTVYYTEGAPVAADSRRRRRILFQTEEVIR